MKRWQIGKGKHFWFLVVIILGIFFLSAMAIPPVAGANGPPEVTKTTQIKEELDQIKKRFGEIKNSLENKEKKWTEDLKSTDKELDDLDLQLMIVIIGSAIALIALVTVPLIRRKNLSVK